MFYVMQFTGLPLVSSRMTPGNSEARNRWSAGICKHPFLRISNRQQ